MKVKQEIFQILSYLNTTSYSTSFIPLLRILGKDIIEAPFASISLKNALNKEDSILGPWRDLDSQQLMDEKVKINYYICLRMKVSEYCPTISCW